MLSYSKIFNKEVKAADRRKRKGGGFGRRGRGSLGMCIFRWGSWGAKTALRGRIFCLAEVCRAQSLRFCISFLPRPPTFIKPQSWAKLHPRAAGSCHWVDMNKMHKISWKSEFRFALICGLRCFRFSKVCFDSSSEKLWAKQTGTALGLHTQVTWQRHPLAWPPNHKWTGINNT